MNPVAGQVHSDQVVYVANINYGQQLNPLPEKQIAEFLLQAENRISQVGFQWIRLHQPPAGSCFLIIQPSSQPQLPEDGYLWNDQETAKRVSLNQYTLEILSREQGAKPGEQFPSIVKRRFRLLNSKNQLQFIHYLSADFSSRLVIPSQQQQQSHHLSNQKYQQHQPPQVPQSQHTQQQQQQPKYKQQRTSNAGSIHHNATADPNEHFRFIGDDMDALTQRDIATVRYKRNHHFLAELFSPSTIECLARESKSLFPQQQPSGSKDMNGTYESGNDVFREEQAKKLASLEQEIEDLKMAHQNNIKKIRDDSKLIYSALASIPEYKTPQDIQQGLVQISTEFGMKAIPAGKIVRVNKNGRNNADDGSLQSLTCSDEVVDVNIDDLLKQEV